MLREDFENLEMKILAPYAMKSCQTRGRRYDEPKHPYRTEFQRDRDRIVHSTAFRRLEYKTQVFVNHEGDHYRTRLTHSLEVAMIARAIARNMGLNEDLTEAIALAHDLGHTPFGHSGEDALNELLKDNGGFEHNRQCIRVVDFLERRYPEFPGLNLTYELREGIIKHHSNYDNPAQYEDFGNLNPTLECQIVNIADEVAYNCHDVDDGLSSGILGEEQLGEIDLWKEQIAEVKKHYPDADEQMRRHIMVRYLINLLVMDITSQSEKNIKAADLKSADDVCAHKNILISFSPPIRERNSQLKLFLYQHMYKHVRMVRMAEKARMIIQELYKVYMRNVDTLPAHIKGRIGSEPQHLVVADYIAGMTDRFAAAEYKKLVDPFERV